MTTLALALLLSRPAAAAPVAVRVVSVDSGTLTADGRPAPAGAELADGAALSLDAGEAVLDVPQAGRLLLKGPARLALGAARLSLSQGGLLSVLDRLKGRFEVATPAAVAAVRGTEFYVEARGLDATYVCLCRGKLDVLGPAGVRYKTRLKAKHHSAFLFKLEGGRLARSAAPMEHHTDAEIERLASLGVKGR